MIRNVRLDDAQQIADIYNYYVIHTIITFEEKVVSAEEIEKQISEMKPNHPWIVYEDNGEIIGYAYAGTWKSRCAYLHTVESSIYLKHGTDGKGIGTTLYEALISLLQNTDIHSVIGGIAIPNDQSIQLHQKLGFEKIGHFKEVGYKFNRWIDVTYWELILNSK